MKKALFLITGDKAPGTNGFVTHFYKDAWHIVNNDVIEAVLDTLQSGRVLKELNTAVISLIPKTNCPQNVSEFGLISYYNTLYHYITKVLCGRLRRLLPDLIMEN